MYKKETQANVPFQVQSLIDSLLDPKDNLYLRGNFRGRLLHIQEQIESAIKKYDHEVMLSSNNEKNKKKKA
jgi:hypothetical protein